MSWEFMSLSELSSWRQAAEAGSVSLSSEEVSALLSEIRERWSEVSAMLSGGVVPNGQVNVKCLSV